MSKKRIFSGVQPSGNLHLGNYLGAILQWVDLQNEYESIFCVVDYHAITVRQDPEILRKKIIEIARIYLAAGIDPKKSIIFQQSDVRAHTELAWILNCTSARISDLNKMTQFKDKAGEKVNNVSVGLFDYPILQAADILLYDTELVPVGEDQIQHIELARGLAKRFNHNYEEVFKLPKAKVMKEGARIMALDDPTKKMSKSANSESSWIGLLDDPKKAMKKIMKATTDAGTEVKYDLKNKPGISNLLTIYSLLSQKSIKDLEKEYGGKMYGEFKKYLAQVVEEFLISFQEKYNAIKESEVRDILDDGARRADLIAEEVLGKVKEVIGVS
jgi:tryptophanyl-tRNA synthetase